MVEINVTFRKPVSWLNPAQLLRTGIKAAEAGLFGAFADRREVIAALSPGAEIPTDPPVFDYSGEDEVWFDYICDTGDGWNATYAIASLVGQPILSVEPADQIDAVKPPPLPCADFTIFGGDEVYPTASAVDYQTRMIDPFYCANPTQADINSALVKAAKPGVQIRPTVYALPGNHDWYDGLTSFMRLFLQKNRRLGPWISGQERTYSAIKLPHNLWIWGVDVQLESDIDASQIAYFKNYAALLEPGHKVILCTPEPTWVEGADTRLQGAVNSKVHENLLHLETLIKDQNAEIPVRIAGDLHHYARYESTNTKSHLITCGGGGAFLHSTHPLHGDIELDGGMFEQSYKRQKTFPTAVECLSRRLGVFGIISNNPGFAFTVGGIYAFYAWILGSASQIYLGGINDHQYLFEYFYTTRFGFFWEWWSVIRYSFLCALVTLVIPVGAAFYGYSFRRKEYLSTNDKAVNTAAASFIGGFIHGALHLLVAVGLMRLAACIHFTPASIALFVTLFLIAVAGFFIGSMLMAVYLLVANVLYGGHDEELFSSQAIQDFKCFARFRVGKDGVTVYPIRVKAVPSAWKPDSRITAFERTGSFEPHYKFTLPSGNAPLFVPADNSKIEGQLIENPIPLR